MSSLNWRSVVVGILATITMDIFSFTALKLGWIAFLPPRLTGRWFASIARGQFLHADIAQAPPINHEMAVAAPMHYLVGITLALLYLLASSVLGFSSRNLIAALGFALCSTLLPWLLMFPAMGYGWFGTHGPQGTRLFMSSLVTHSFYGIGLWFGSSMLAKT
jgi:hypothetical protein